MKLESLVFVMVIVGLKGICSPWLVSLWCEKYTILQNELTLQRPRGFISFATFKEFQSLNKLTLHSSEIESMENGSLCSLKNLQELKIECKINFPKLTHETMGECDKLKRFEFTKSLRWNNEFSNNFDTDVFKSMKNVESIYLNNLDFEKFDKALLEGLTSLTNFTLLKGKIEEIDDDAFCTSPNLEVLYLEINTDIFSRRLFNSCNNVKILYLLSDHKNVFKENTLQGMTKLMKIHLEVNLVTVTKNLFANLFDLKTISLGKCHIIHIEEDAFTDQTNLKELIIKANSINKLDALYLKPLKNVELLNLTYDGLTGIDNLEFLPNLKMLDVSNNEIQDFNATIVKQRLPKVEKIIINNYLGCNKFMCKRAVEIMKEFGSKTELVIDCEN